MDLEYRLYEHSTLVTDSPIYNYTETDLFPTDWSMCSIGELFHFLRSASNSRADLGDTDGVAYVHYGDIHTRFHHFIDFTRDHIPSLLCNKHVTATTLREGDLIVVDASEDEAGVGKSVEVCNLGTIKAVSGLHTILMRCKNQRVQNGYRGYLLESEPVKKQLRQLSTGLKVFGISKQAISNVQVPLPSPDEQRAIAKALTDVDELHTALDALIAKKRDIKQAAMQQLLTGKTRLPGFGGAWETKRLEHIINCLDHVRIPLNETQRGNMPGPYPYCGANGVLDYVNDFVIDDDVILIAEDGGFFDEYVHRPIAYRMKGKIWVNNHAHILKAKRGYSQGFLFFSLVHKNIVPYLASGTRAKLNKSEMNKIEINLPLRYAEQKAIASVLSNMEAEIATLESRREKTRTVKQGMMQQLLTGRVRLINPGHV